MGKVRDFCQRKRTTQNWRVRREKYLLEDVAVGVAFEVVLAEGFLSDVAGVGYLRKGEVFSSGS